MFELRQLHGLQLTIFLDGNNLSILDPQSPVERRDFFVVWGFKKVVQKQMKTRGDKSHLLFGRLNALIAKRDESPPGLSRLEKRGIKFSIGGTIISALLGIISIYLAIKISKQQTEIKDLSIVINELREQNKATKIAMENSRTQIDTLTTIAKQLRTANFQGLDLNNQVVDLVQETRRSDEPQIGLVKPLVSYLGSFPDSVDLSGDAATFNQIITFKNYGRREAIPVAIYVYLFQVRTWDIPNSQSKTKIRTSKYLPLAQATTGVIDTSINYQKILPGDTLGYSFSTPIGGYWNGEYLINDYEVVKLIYQDPIGGTKEKKFYFQYDSNSSVNFVIPKKVQSTLDSLTKHPPQSPKKYFNFFQGIIRPNR